MKLKFECPNCASSFNVPEEYAGKRAKCAKCNQSFVVAFSTDFMDEVFVAKKQAIRIVCSSEDLRRPLSLQKRLYRVNLFEGK